MYVSVSLVSLFVGGWAVQWIVWLGDRRRAHRKLRADRRLGLLGTGNVLSAEHRRAARLAELGADGTYKTYNCGEILHVDYENGILTCSREGRFR